MATLQEDSGVNPAGEGYERTLIFINWDPSNPARMAQVLLRVDRNPEGSYAKVNVWSPEKQGWQYVTSSHISQWWDRVPGYSRWRSEGAESKTFSLANDLIGTLQAMRRQGLFA